jgi:hypothetical protein
MDPLDLELQKAFAATQPIPPAQVDALSRRVVDTFARKQRGIARLTAFYHVALALAMFTMIALFFSLSDLKQCILLAVGILMATAGLVVIKLWFWTMHGKFATLREIKLLQLAVADLRAAQPNLSPAATASSAAESFAVPSASPATPSTHQRWWLALAPLWLLAVAGVVYFGWLRSPHEPHDIIQYVEKSIPPAEATPGSQWRQTFEVTQETQHFHPQLSAADTHARLWISVAPEGQAPAFTGTLQPASRFTFGHPAPGKYTLLARVEQPDANMTLRLAGTNQAAGATSFLPMFLLLLSAALALAIPLVYLQSRWLRHLDPDIPH